MSIRVLKNGKRHVIALAAAALMAGSGGVSSAQASTSKKLNYDVHSVSSLLNLIKCEVAKFQVQSADDNERFKITKAHITLELSVSNKRLDNTKFEVGLPVIISDKLDIGASLSGEIEKSVTERRELKLLMNTVATDTSICDEGQNDPLEFENISILDSLLDAKRSIDLTAAGEPKIGVESFTIDRRFLLTRKQEDDASVSVFFLSVGDRNSQISAVSQHLSIKFDLTKRAGEVVAYKATRNDANNLWRGNQGNVFSDMSQLFRLYNNKTPTSGGRTFFYTKPGDGGITEWTVLPVCEVMNNCKEKRQPGTMFMEANDDKVLIPSDKVGAFLRGKDVFVQKAPIFDGDLFKKNTQTKKLEFNDGALRAFRRLGGYAVEAQPQNLNFNSQQIQTIDSIQLQGNGFRN